MAPTQVGKGTNGIDALLQAVAKYKKKDPATPDEEECCENLFNSLCSALVSAVPASPTASP